MKTDKSEKERQELHEKILQVEQKKMNLCFSNVNMRILWEFCNRFSIFNNSNGKSSL